MALAVAVCLTSCVPADLAIHLSRAYSEETTMGAIQSDGEIVIGIPASAPPLGSLNRDAQRARGLSAVLGRYAARTLGVEPRWVSGTSSELIQKVEAGAADLAFVTSALTEEAVRNHSFAGPYFVAHQRLLVRRRGPRALGGVRGRVCAALDPVTGVDLNRLNPAIELEPVRRIDACVPQLESGEARAATAADAALARLELALDDGWEIVGDDLNTVGYGVAVAPRQPLFVRWITSVLARAEAEGVWSDAYARLLEPELGPSEPPDLTVEEAAALYPEVTPDGRRASE